LFLNEVNGETSKEATTTESGLTKSEPSKSADVDLLSSVDVSGDKEQQQQFQQDDAAATAASNLLHECFLKNMTNSQLKCFEARKQQQQQQQQSNFYGAKNQPSIDLPNDENRDKISKKQRLQQPAVSAVAAKSRSRSVSPQPTAHATRSSSHSSSKSRAEEGGHNEAGQSDSENSDIQVDDEDNDDSLAKPKIEQEEEEQEMDSPLPRQLVSTSATTNLASDKSLEARFSRKTASKRQRYNQANNSPNTSSILINGKRYYRKQEK
jgi:hypothetical protein